MSISKTPCDSPLRITVIGAHTASPESSRPYTVYRTVISYNQDCYERLFRYRDFRSFYKRLKFRHSSTRCHAPFPSKTLKRSTSLDDEVVEERQVMLNEFMQEVCQHELSKRSEEYLFKWLRIGQYEDASSLRMSEFSRRSSLASSFATSKEDDDQDDLSDKDSQSMRNGSLLIHQTCMVPVPSNITSNATTILSEDDRMSFMERLQAAEGEAEEWMLEEQERLIAEAHANVALRNSVLKAPPRPPLAPRLNMVKAPSNNAVVGIVSGQEYAQQLVVKKPVLRTSQSLPTSAKRVAFVLEDEEEQNIETIHLQNEEPSPTTDYHRQLIETQLASIRHLMEESDQNRERIQVQAMQKPNYPKRLATV